MSHSTVHRRLERIEVQNRQIYQLLKRLLKQERIQMSALDDQIKELKDSEEAEHKEIASAVERVNSKLDSIGQSNPELQSVIDQIKQDTATAVGLAANAPAPEEPISVP